MHTLQPKHFKLKPDEIEKILTKFNIALSQLPKISKKDPAIPQDCKIGDVLKIQRQTETGMQEYFRVVI